MTETGMDIAAVNALPPDAFVAHFGFLFEHSAWIVREAARRRPFADRAAMEAALAAVIAAAGHGPQLKLLRAHPELAGRAAVDHMLTAASNAEQAGAGLDRLSEAEFARFHDLNARYRSRFGFPFILCVRGAGKAAILAAMAARLANTEEQEIAAALGEVGRIAHHRLADLVA